MARPNDFLRWFGVIVLALAAGCAEGTKPEPLTRAGVPGPAAKKPVEQTNNETTLYERLGREDGITQTVDQMLKDLSNDAKTQTLAAKINRRNLIDFLMEVSSKPRPRLADDLLLSPTDWSLLLPGLRATMTARAIAGRDREELIGNIEKSR